MFCSFYAAAVVIIISRRELSTDLHHGNKPNKSKLVLLKALPQVCMYNTVQGGMLRDNINTAQGKAKCCIKTHGSELRGQKHPT